MRDVAILVSLVLLFILLGFVLGRATPQDTQAPHAQAPRVETPNPRYVARAEFATNEGIWIWRDPSNGCEYVIAVTVRGPSITPRMQRNTALAGGADRQVCR